MESPIPTSPKQKLLDRVRDVMRLKHDSDRTGQSDVAWIRRCILFHNKCHPKGMGLSEGIDQRSRTVGAVCGGPDGSPGDRRDRVFDASGLGKQRVVTAVVCQIMP